MGLVLSGLPWTCAYSSDHGVYCIVGLVIHFPFACVDIRVGMGGAREKKRKRRGREGGRFEIVCSFSPVNVVWAYPGCIL